MRETMMTVAAVMGICAARAKCLVKDGNSVVLIGDSITGQGLWS